MENDGRERGVSGSQIRLVPTRSLLVSLTLSTGARFHCFTDKRPQKHGTGSRSHQKSVALTQPRPPEPSLFAPLPILQDAGTPAVSPYQARLCGLGAGGSAGARGRRLQGTTAGQEGKQGKKESRAAGARAPPVLRAARNYCRGNRTAASSQRVHPQGMLAL